ncbi:4441_t:CDS:1, partial [Scutellospora calospora]
TTTENRVICYSSQTNTQLPQPLNAFFSFPLHIWNDISKNNNRNHDIHMFISAHP